MRDLKNSSIFERISLPITLVCAGNRRKEQNLVSKSLGFNWGSAGTSTGIFTGIYLCDLLDHVGLKHLRDGARHVIFEGADQLPDGPYGTSQSVQVSKDKTKGLMLAWAMNGLPLELSLILLLLFSFFFLSSKAFFFLTLMD